MTCGIMYKPNNRIVYGAADQALTSLVNGAYVITGITNKVSILNGVLCVFAGPRGIQDILETYPNIMDPAIEYDNSARQKLINILSCLDSSKTAQILASAGNNIVMASTITVSCSVISKEYATIGSGADVAYGAMGASSETVPIKRMQQAISITSSLYSTISGFYYNNISST